MRIDDPVDVWLSTRMVIRKPRIVRTVLMSEPEFGWVLVRGWSGVAGPVSLPVRCVRAVLG